MSTAIILPSRQTKIKSFESQDMYIDHAGGRLHLRNMSTMSIDNQVSAWVDETKNIIETPGIMYIMASQVNMPAETIQEQLDKLLTNLGPIELKPMHSVWVETRTFVLTYVPAVEQLDVECYRQNSGDGQIPGLAKRAVAAFTGNPATVAAQSKRDEPELPDIP